MPSPLLDYAALAEEAKTLVEGTGRAVTFLRLDRVPVDPLKPWEGPTDPRATATTVDGYAVFVDPSSARQLGMSTSLQDTLVKRNGAIMIVALGATAADISSYDEVLDGTEYSKILGVEKLRPADVTLLYFVGVAGA